MQSPIKEIRWAVSTNITAGLVGSSIGQAIFGEWRPKATSMALIPSILGAVILVAVLLSFSTLENDHKFLQNSKLKGVAARL